MKYTLFICNVAGIQQRSWHHCRVREDCMPRCQFQILILLFRVDVMRFDILPSIRIHLELNEFSSSCPVTCTTLSIASVDNHDECSLTFYTTEGIYKSFVRGNKKNLYYLSEMGMDANSDLNLKKLVNTTLNLSLQLQFSLLFA